MFPFGFSKSNVVTPPPPLTVDWDGNAVATVRTGATCYATQKFDADGDKYKSNNQGNFAASYKTWLSAGLNSEVWVERTINSGSLNTDNIGAGRVVMSTDRLLGLEKASSGAPATANVTVDFYDAASGGTLLATGVLTLSATYE